MVALIGSKSAIANHKFHCRESLYFESKCWIYDFLLWIWLYMNGFNEISFVDVSREREKMTNSDLEKMIMLRHILKKVNISGHALYQ